MWLIKCLMYLILLIFLVTGAMLNYRQYEAIGERERRERLWIEEIKPRVQPRSSSYKWTEKGIDASNNGLKKIDRSPLTSQQLNP